MRHPIKDKREFNKQASNRHPPAFFNEPIPTDKRHIIFHAFRHTCASLLSQRNVHSKFVQKLLRHASVAITLDTYSHMLPGMGGEATDAIGEALE
ncbi:MAG: tyrosine-type recombinase/integrase [Rubrobacteraceae bacterium]